MNPVDELPDDLAVALRRILFFGGTVELLFDRFLDPAGEDPPRRGLSGTELVKALRKVDAAGTPSKEIIDGFEAMHEWRNHLTHGANSYSNGVLWTWREPTRARGNAGFSYQFRLADLQKMADGWQNLAIFADDELHRRDSAATSA